MTRSIWWLTVAFFLWSAATNLVIPFVPLVASAHGATPFQVGLVQGTVYAGAAIAMLPAHWLARRWGGRFALWAAWATGGLGAVLMGLAGSWTGLLPGALLLLAGAGAIPALAAMVAELVPGHRLRQGMSLVFAAAPAGLLVGSSVGGLVAEGWGMGALFFIAAALSVVAMGGLVPMVDGGLSRPAAEVAAGVEPSAGAGAKAARMLLLIGVPAGVGYLLLSLPGGFLTPYLRDVAGFSLSGTGITNGQLAIGQLAWSALFAAWPVRDGTVELRVGTLVKLRLNRGTLLAIAVCMAANAAFGVLFPSGSAVAVIAALILRGSLFSLQPLGMALVSEVTGTGNGLTGSFSALAVIMGLATAGAPVIAGMLYAGHPAWPFYVTGLAAAVGGALCFGVRRMGVQVG